MTKIIVYSLLGLAVLGTIFYTGIKSLRGEAKYAAYAISRDANSAKDSIKNLETNQANLYANSILTQLNTLYDTVPVWFSLIPKLKAIPDALNDAQAISLRTVKITEKLDDLKKNGLGMVMNRQGERLIAILKEILAEIKSIETQTDLVIKKAQAIQPNLKIDQSQEKLKLFQAQTSLENLISFLESDKPIRIVIAFQNPTEIRPTGGFMGSLAIATLTKASLDSLNIEDIYDIDGQLKEKITPPLALQNLTINWGARDANFFFDFPTSAINLIALLEKSKTFSDHNTKFDGVIAINTNLLQKILKIIGPIELTEQKITIDADNFLEQIQAEVETNKNKNVLKDLLPIIFERLGKLDPNNKAYLITNIKDGVENKDLMFYFKDKVINGYMEDFGVDGALPNLDSETVYVALSRANISGNKTDLFTKEDLHWEIEIAKEEINYTLTLKKAYAKNNKKEKWYKGDNKHYVELITNNDASLVKIDGGEAPKKITRSYSLHAKNLDLKNWESGYFGKYKIFPTYFNLKMGEEKELVFNWKEKLKVDPEAKSARRNFRFDKQSGVEAPIKITIKTSEDWEIKNADLGMVEKEFDGSAKTFEVLVELVKRF